MVKIQKNQKQPKVSQTSNKAQKCNHPRITSRRIWSYDRPEAAYMLLPACSLISIFPSEVVDE